MKKIEEYYITLGIEAFRSFDSPDNFTLPLFQNPLRYYGEIEIFMRELERNDVLPYIIEYGEGNNVIDVRPTELAKYLKRLRIWRVGEYVADIKVSEYVQVFVEHAASLLVLNRRNIDSVEKYKRLKQSSKLFDKFTTEQILKTVLDANMLIKEMRNCLRSPEFKKANKSRHDNISRNTRGVEKKLNEIFNHGGAVTVVGVQLGFKLETTTFGFERICIAEAVEYKKKLINNIRKNTGIIKGCISSVIFLEYARTKGFHFCCYFIFEGSLIDPIKKGQQICEYWQEAITNGVGDFDNCNARTNYRNLGLISHWDVLKRDGFINDVLIQCESHKYLRYKHLGKHRTFQISLYNNADYKSPPIPSVGNTYQLQQSYF